MVAGAEAVGVFIVGEVRDGLLMAVRVDPMGCFPFDLVLVLLLVVLSSSSDEMSTMVLADIIGCRPLVRLWISNLRLSQALEH